MKIFYILLLLLLSSVCFAADTPMPSEDSLKDVINKSEELIKNATEFSKYEKLKFKNKDKNLNFSEMSDVDKKIFVFYKCEEISYSLFTIQLKIEKRDDIEEKEKKEFLQKIFSLRKVHVKNFENFVKKSFEDDKFSELDKDKYLKRINDWHSKNMKEKNE